MQNKGFTNLLVWQKAMDLVEMAYSISAKFPEAEKFALTNQLRRAAVSIPANIAEGKGRYSDKEFVNFLYIARGSLEETKCLLILSNRLQYVKEDELTPVYSMSEEVGALLNSLINSMKK